MKRITTLVAAAFTAAAIFIGTNANAQTSDGDSKNVLRFGVGLEAAAPVGDLHDFSNFGLGGTARLQYDFPKTASIMLTSGYYNFFAKDNGIVNTPDQGVVPVKLGAKIFAAKNFYFSGEAGAGFETKYGKNTKLILSPGLGYASDGGWDIGLRYENFSGQSNNYGMVGVRLAYGFPF